MVAGAFEAGSTGLDIWKQAAFLVAGLRIGVDHPEAAMLMCIKPHSYFVELLAVFGVSFAAHGVADVCLGKQVSFVCTVQEHLPRMVLPDSVRMAVILVPSFSTRMFQSSLSPYSTGSFDLRTISRDTFAATCGSNVHIESSFLRYLAYCSGVSHGLIAVSLDALVELS